MGWIVGWYSRELVTLLLTCGTEVGVSLPTRVISVSVLLLTTVFSLCGIMLTRVTRLSLLLIVHKTKSAAAMLLAEGFLEVAMVG